MIHGYIDEMVELAPRGATAVSTSEVLERAVLAAAREIASCDLAGICVVDPRGATTYAARHASVELIDELQLRLGEGPVLEQLRHRCLVTVADLLDSGPRESEWDAIGVRSFIGFRLVLGDGVIGVLNLYSFVPDAFTSRDVSQGLALAARAADALCAA